MSNPQMPPPPSPPAPKMPGKPSAKDDGKKIDFSELDLKKFDLTRKYDDDFSAADGIPLRDHVLLYAIAALLALFLLWANFTTLEEVARGEGKVIPSSQVQIVQSLEGGIVDEFLVKTGDIVKEGQVLLRIRDIQAKSDYAANSQKYYGLLAATIRLQAEAEGKEPVFGEEVIKHAPEAVRIERDAFNANKRQAQGQIDVTQQQLIQKEGELEELSRRIADTASVLTLAQEERAMIAPMVEKGAANRMELLQTDRQIATQRAELNGLRAALPRTQAAIKEAKSRMEELISGVKATAQKELAEKSLELNTTKETLSALQDRSDRTDVKSPVHGKVQDMKITTVGGVAKPGEPILEIVPLEDQLVVEARIKPSDISFIYPGQKAVVRVSSFDFSVYGSLEGQVIDISPTSFETQKGEIFYRVKIRTKETKVHKGDKEYEISPGNQATVDIITGEKTLMKYLLKPFVKASQTALRER